MGAHNKGLEPAAYPHRLTALTAVVDAMRWASRQHPIETFWDEAFDSLILCADAHVGLVDLLVDGILPRQLASVMDEVFASLAHRLGHRFRAHRPFGRFRGPAELRPAVQLTWFFEQADIGVLLVAGDDHRRWVACRAVDDEGRLIGVDSRSSPDGEPLASAIAPKTIIVVERVLE